MPKIGDGGEELGFEGGDNKPISLEHLVLPVDLLTASIKEDFAKPNEGNLMPLKKKGVAYVATEEDLENIDIFQAALNQELPPEAAAWFRSLNLRFEERFEGFGKK